MIPLLKGLWFDFWYSPEKARLWLRSVLGFITLVLVQVFSYPWDDVKDWSKQEIVYRLAAAGLGAVALGIGVGEKNPKVPPPPLPLPKP